MVHNFGPNGPSGNRFAAENMPETFNCPSTPRSGPATQFKDYAMNGGNTDGASSCCPERATRFNGIGYKNSKVNMRDITDGTSNTFLLLEQSSVSQASDMVGIPTNPFFWVNHSSNGLALSHQGGTSFPPNHVQNQLSGRTSRGDHPTGLMTAYCDGSVAFIPETIAVNPWRNLHNRADGNVVTKP